MTNKNMQIWSVGLALAGVATTPSLADYSYGDSAEFPLDLLTVPAGGTGDWADSPGFSVDLWPVNRGWAD